jgi:uncharacterized protein with HEPN domain
VTYRDRQRLADVQAAIDAIRSHLQRGTLADALVFDAVRIRLLEIGEAVKALPAEILDTQPAIPWSQITRMRDHLAHRYFDTAHAILQATVDDDLPELERAIQAMTRSLPDDEDKSPEEMDSTAPRPASAATRDAGGRGLRAACKAREGARRGDRSARGLPSCDRARLSWGQRRLRPPAPSQGSAHAGPGDEDKGH